MGEQDSICYILFENVNKSNLTIPLTLAYTYMYHTTCTCVVLWKNIVTMDVSREISCSVAMW